MSSNEDRPKVYQITYFRKSGKYYTTDEVIWPTDDPDHSGFNPLSSFHRIKTMYAVCMEAPHGFPQFSPPAKEDELDGSEASTSPFHIEREEDGQYRIYVYHVGLFPIGDRKNTEMMLQSLERERARRNAVVNGEMRDLRALLARAVDLFGGDDEH